MKKTLLTIFFTTFFTILNAYEIGLKDKIPIFYVFEKSIDVRNIDEAIANPQLFDKRYYLKSYKRRAIKDEILSYENWYKIDLKNSSDEFFKGYIFTKWENVDIDIYLVENKKVVQKDRLKEYDNLSISKLFNIEPNKDLELYFNVKNRKGIDNLYYLYIVEQDNIFNLMTQKEMFHNGIFIGLLLSMVLYNLYIYLSIKEKSYLYLGIYQCVILVFVTDISDYLLLLLRDFPYIAHVLVKQCVPILINVASVIFVKEFLDTKNKFPSLDKVLTIAVLLNIVLELFSKEIIQYSSILHMTYVFVGIYALIKGNRAAIFFIAGFTLTSLFYIFASIVMIFHLDFYLERISSIQILASVEGIVLSIALYLRIKQIANEKNIAQLNLIEQEKIVLSQSRFATMGEMLGSISHQWKQPLTHLSMIFASLQMADETKKLTSFFLNRKVNEANEQIQYMSKTINDYNNFLANKKDEIEEYLLKDVCDEALKLTNSRGRKLKIKVYFDIKSDRVRKNDRNSLGQVLIILLNNAYDALMMNNEPKNRFIHITILEDKICISDNAGGIPENIINKIFDPYFTTKHKKFGTGMGLFTAKRITEEILKGNLIVKNNKRGAVFCVIIPQK